MSEFSINIKHKIDRTLNNKWVEYAPYIIIRNGHMFVDSYSAEGQRPTRFELIDEGNPWYGVYFTWNGVCHPRRKVSSIEEPIDMISVSGLEEYPFDVDGFCVSFQPSCIIISDNNGLKVRYEVPFNDKGCMREEWSNNDVIIPFDDFNCRQDESSDIYILIDDLFSIRLNDNIERR